MNRIVLLAGCTLFLLAGCNIAASQPITETPTMPPPSATLRPTPFPTSTPAPPTAALLVKSELVNCRFGPGTIFLTINELKQGQSLRAMGRNNASNWFYVNDPGNPGGFCWISSDVVETQDDIKDLTIVPPPVASITNIDLRVEPNRIVVNCNEFPQTVFFEALVTTNGPTLFTWRWENSLGVTSDDGTLVFEEAGTQAINEFYQINAPNDYWVRLHVLTPDERFEQVNFPVSCTP